MVLIFGEYNEDQWKHMETLQPHTWSQASPGSEAGAVYTDGCFHRSLLRCCHTSHRSFPPWTQTAKLSSQLLIGGIVVTGLCETTRWRTSHISHCIMWWILRRKATSGTTVRMRVCLHFRLNRKTQHHCPWVGRKRSLGGGSSQEEDKRIST